jgi:hypothetical protein
MIYLSIALGGFVSGYLAHNRVKGRGFIDGIIGASVYLVMLLFILSLLIKLNLSANILIIVPIAIASGFVGGVAKA